MSGYVHTHTAYYACAPGNACVVGSCVYLYCMFFNSDFSKVTKNQVLVNVAYRHVLIN